MSGATQNTAQYPVDKFRSGYPRYAALLSSHPSFQNFRRFSRVRMRLLLVKQNEISLLEKLLDQLDEQEDRDLFLGCMSRDANPQRKQVLNDLKAAMAEYDQMVESCRRAVSMPAARQRDVQNLVNWLDGAACLDRQESSYLECHDDLANFSEFFDNSTALADSLVEECVFWLQTAIRNILPSFSNFQITQHRFTEDDHVLFLGPKMQFLSRSIIICVATGILLGPTAVLLGVTSPSHRVLVSIFAAVIFLSALSFFTRAKTAEIFIAGASYAAVLVAFTATNSDSASL